MAVTKEDLMKNFSEALNQEIKNVDETMLPLLRVYLENIREIRMSFGREVRDILRESRNLDEITKNNETLAEFAVNLAKLKQILTPEFVEILGRLVKKE